MHSMFYAFLGQGLHSISICFHLHTEHPNQATSKSNLSKRYLLGWAVQHQSDAQNGSAQAKTCHQMTEMTFSACSVPDFTKTTDGHTRMFMSQSMEKEHGVRIHETWSYTTQRRTALVHKLPMCTYSNITGQTIVISKLCMCVMLVFGSPAATPIQGRGNSRQAYHRTIAKQTRLPPDITHCTHLGA